jgi:hypothetical protein
MVGKCLVSDRVRALEMDFDFDVLKTPPQSIRPSWRGSSAILFTLLMPCGKSTIGFAREDNASPVQEDLTVYKARLYSRFGAPDFDDHIHSIPLKLHSKAECLTSPPTHRPICVSELNIKPITSTPFQILE